MAYRIGIDIGGTFTDFILIHEETNDVSVLKLLTTARAPQEGATRGVAELIGGKGLNVQDCRVLVHGTTLIVNSLTERKGARTGLVTTRGFRDILEIRTEQRYDPYDLGLRFPEPLVPRPWRFEVDERVLADGTVARTVDAASLERVVNAIRHAGLESVALVFLHAFMNPSNEQVAARVLVKALDGVELSTSSTVAPEVGEYQRTSTVVANAYVQPLVRRYVSSLDDGLERADVQAPLFMMSSSGGLMGVQAATALPIRIVESGPAAGAVAAGRWAERNAWPHVLSFDMGGTTAKICVVDRGAPTYTGELEVARMHRYKRGSGLPIRVPTIELLEIGSGGGSIARIDQLGLLKVGPESAGADPGPACYGFGGRDATVTDASVVLGYMDPDAFLGGAMKLDRNAAERAIEEGVGERLALSALEAAAAIHRVVNENMASALRIHMAERGKDPRQYVMLAFGGAGPIHATAIARSAGLSRVVVPRWAGALSALGLVLARPAFDVARSYVSRIGNLDWQRVRVLFQEMEDECLANLKTFGEAGADTEVIRTADMRYAGQEHLLTVELPSGRLEPSLGDSIRSVFHDRHNQIYGFVDDESDVEALVWRVSVRGRRPSYQPADWDGQGSARRGSRTAFFPDVRREVTVPVWDRYRLFRGEKLDGPGIIEERESTIVLRTRDRAEVDAEGNLVIEVGRDE